jgi:integrase
MPRELRRVQIELSDARLRDFSATAKRDITAERVFVSPDEGVLDPDNLYHRYFIPVLTKFGIREIRLHGLRRAFGSLLIQSGTSIVYVEDQMGHSPIQATVDLYGHLIPGADVSFVYRLDEKSPE